MSSTASAERQQTQPSNFRFDTSKIEWKDFLTEGCYYRILDVNVEAHTADMLVKFEPGARCLFHRHVAATATLGLEGSLQVFDLTVKDVVEQAKAQG